MGLFVDDVVCARGVNNEKDVLGFCVTWIGFGLGCGCGDVGVVSLDAKFGGAIGFGQLGGGVAVKGGCCCDDRRPLTRACFRRRDTDDGGSAGWCSPLVASASAPTLPLTPA